MVSTGNNYLLLHVNCNATHISVPTRDWLLSEEQPHQTATAAILVENGGGGRRITRLTTIIVPDGELPQVGGSFCQYNLSNLWLGNVFKYERLLLGELRGGAHWGVEQLIPAKLAVKYAATG